MTETLSIQPVYNECKKKERLMKKLLHLTGKAIADYKMIHHGDTVLVCLSGGKDSHTLLTLLLRLKNRAKINFQLKVLTMDQGQPGWDDQALRQYLDSLHISYEIIHEDTYSIVKSKIPENKTYCSLCSRLRRGTIYTYAKKNGCNKVALGHHRDDLIESLMMGVLFNGEIRSMPPKLLTDDTKLMVIRPMTYCQENDIRDFAQLTQYPIIPCNLCGNQENLARKKIKKLIRELEIENSKIPSNMLHAISTVRASQLMDKTIFDFDNLDQILYQED